MVLEMSVRYVRIIKMLILDPVSLLPVVYIKEKYVKTGRADLYKLPGYRR